MEEGFAGAIADQVRDPSTTTVINDSPSVEANALLR